MGKISKHDWISIAVLTVIYILFVVVTYAKWGNPVVDCFRNAYVPDMLLQGKVLYKDLFFFYCPLISYFNALLFFIFGIKLEVLYFSGIIVTFLILLCSYYLSRQVLGCLFSVILLLVFLVQSVFRPSIQQYIFPYSYEALYSCLLLLCLIICIVELVKREFKSPGLFYLSAIIVSLTTIVKQDSAIAAYLCFYVLIAYLLTTKKFQFKLLLPQIVLTIFLPAIYIALFSLVIPIEDLISGLLPFDIFSIYYIKHFSGSIINLQFLMSCFKAFLVYVPSLLLFVALIYFCIWLLKKYYTEHYLKITFVIMGLCIILSLLWKDFSYTIGFTSLISLCSKHYIYQWIALFLLGYLIYYLYKIFKKKESLNLQDKIILIYIISGILLMFRNPLAVSLQAPSNFYIFIPLVVFYYFLYNLSNFITKLDQDVYQKALSISLILIIFSLAGYFKNIYDYKSIPIKTDRGLIYVTPLRGPQIAKGIELINRITSKNDYIFTAPEESIFYFMTARKGVSKYYQLLPGFTDKESAEKEIIDNLQAIKPKLILLTNNKVVQLYGKKQWGVDYNTSVFKWIKRNYSFVGAIKLTIDTGIILKSSYEINTFVVKPSEKF